MPEDFFSEKSQARSLPGLAPGSRRDVSERIAQAVGHSIAAGGFRQGEKVPSPAAIARRYSASIHTVRRALAILVDEGVVSHEPGRGYFVKGGSD